MDNAQELTQRLKDHALQQGADLIGIAPIERFDEAPIGWHPKSVFPRVRFVVVIGLRILRGCYRGMDEKTLYQTFSTYGYGWLNYAVAPTIVRSTALFIENNGYEAVPIPEYTSARESSRLPAPDEVGPEVFLHSRMAAVAAGLGERGYSGVFLSPEFGPNQRLYMILTDAPLVADPLFSGSICDNCMECVRKCKGGAISDSETVSATMDGKEFRWGKLDTAKCAFHLLGLTQKCSPVLPFDTTVPESAKDNYDIYAMAGTVHQAHPLYGALKTQSRTMCLCGSQCSLACMIHLDKKGVLKSKYHTPFPIDETK